MDRKPKQGELLLIKHNNNNNNNRLIQKEVYDTDRQCVFSGTFLRAKLIHYDSINEIYINLWLMGDMKITLNYLPIYKIKFGNCILFVRILIFDDAYKVIHLTYLIEFYPLCPRSLPNTFATVRQQPWEVLCPV